MSRSEQTDEISQKIRKNSYTPSHHVVVLGSGGVGKSSLTLRLVTQKFSEEYDATIEDSYRKTIMVDNSPVHLEIVDTAGQEEFWSLVDSWIRPADGVIMVFDLGNRQTFDELNKFYDRVLVCKDKSSFPMVVVGNKCDLSDEQKQVKKNEGRILAAMWDCAYIESSALNRVNDEACFYEIVRQIRRHEPTPPPPQTSCCSLM